MDTGRSQNDYYTYFQNRLGRPEPFTCGGAPHSCDAAAGQNPAENNIQPKGPAVSNVGIQAQLTKSGGAMLEDGAAVRFDSILNTFDFSPTDSASGTFTVSRPGTYLIYWWVSVSGTSGPASVAFALRQNDAADVSSAMPAITGQISGGALVAVKTVPSTFSLINVTGGTVSYADVTPQAGIVIAEMA